MIDLSLYFFLLFLHQATAAVQPNFCYGEGPVCIGESTACEDLDSIDCTNGKQMGCTRNIAEPTCDGTATACEDLDVIDCSNDMQAGCVKDVVESACVGTATACEDLGLIDCTSGKHLGCTSQVSNFGLSCTSTGTPEPCSNFNNDGLQCAFQAGCTYNDASFAILSLECTSSGTPEPCSNFADDEEQCAWQAGCQYDSGELADGFGVMSTCSGTSTPCSTFNDDATQCAWQDGCQYYDANADMPCDLDPFDIAVTPLTLAGGLYCGASADYSWGGCSKSMPSRDGVVTFSSYVEQATANNPTGEASCVMDIDGGPCQTCTVCSDGESISFNCANVLTLSSINNDDRCPAGTRCVGWDCGGNCICQSIDGPADTSQGTPPFASNAGGSNSGAPANAGSGSNSGAPDKAGSSTSLCFQSKFDALFCFKRIPPPFLSTVFFLYHLL